MLWWDDDVKRNQIKPPDIDSKNRVILFAKWTLATQIDFPIHPFTPAKKWIRNLKICFQKEHASRINCGKMKPLWFGYQLNNLHPVWLTFCVSVHFFCKLFCLSGTKCKLLPPLCISVYAVSPVSLDLVSKMCPCVTLLVWKTTLSQIGVKQFQCIENVPFVAPPYANVRPYLNVQ